MYLYIYIIYFNASGAWASKENNANQWIQAEFGNDYKITAVQTQGRQKFDQWVEKFKISYSNDGTSWNIFQNADGTEKVRTGYIYLYMQVRCIKVVPRY